MKGRDPVFGNALEEIEKGLQKLEEDEARVEEKEKTKKGPSGDPLKQAKPTDLKGGGEKGTSAVKLARVKKSNVNTKKGPSGDPLKQAKPTDLKGGGEKGANAVKLARVKKSNVNTKKGLASRGLEKQKDSYNEGIDPLADGGDKQDEATKIRKLTEEEEYLDFIMDDKLQEVIDTVLDAGFEISEAKKKDPKAKLRNRGDVVFPAESPNVLDDKDHFPINNKNQARNALARANQYSSSPKWYKGSLASLVKKVANAVKRKYKDIKVTKKAETPGKG